MAVLGCGHLQSLEMGVDLLPIGVPTFCRQTGSPSISFDVIEMGPPHPRNGSFGIQAYEQLCVLGVGNSAGERYCRALEISPDLGGACSCLKEGRAWVLGMAALHLGNRCMRSPAVPLALGWAMMCILHPAMRVFVLDHVLARCPDLSP